MTTVSATTARDNFYKLLEEVDTLGERVAITNKGETKAILMSPEEVASWESTLELASDIKAMRDIKKGLNDIKAGRVVSWEEVKKKAGI